MQWSDIPFKPSNKILRQFAGLWILFFGGMAAWRYASGNPNAALILGALALSLGPIGLVKPALLRPIYVGWMILAFPIGWVISHVLLAALYFGIFTPIALWFRVIGRDTLDRRLRPDLPSYWIPKPAPGDARSYFRQF